MDQKKEAPETILIVDDVPTNIKVLGEALRSHYNVSIATDGDKALRIACGSSMSRYVSCF